MPQSVYARFGQSAVDGIFSSKRQHTVRAGETIQAIASFESSTGYDSELWRQYAEANLIDDLDAIVTNMVLVVPTPQASET